MVGTDSSTTLLIIYIYVLLFWKGKTVCVCVLCNKLTMHEAAECQNMQSEDRSIHPTVTEMRNWTTEVLLKLDRGRKRDREKGKGRETGRGFALDAPPPKNINLRLDSWRYWGGCWVCVDMYQWHCGDTLYVHKFTMWGPSSLLPLVSAWSVGLQLGSDYFNVKWSNAPQNWKKWDCVRCSRFIWYSR